MLEKKNISENLTWNKSEIHYKIPYLINYRFCKLFYFSIMILSFTNYFIHIFLPEPYYQISKSYVSTFKKGHWTAPF